MGEPLQDRSERRRIFAGHAFCGNTVGGSRITGTVSSVHDGDTITVAGNSIRLDSIDAPELMQAYGIQSRDNLANLVIGQSVTVTYAGR